MKLQSLSSVQELRLQHEIRPQKEDGGFQQVMQNELSRTGIQFSKHAAERMVQRGVEMTPTLAQDLNAAVEKARDKGAKDIVVIGAQSAFIVSVSNNTVITTMNAQEMKNNIFTNIDSAVLL